MGEARKKTVDVSKIEEALSAVKVGFDNLYKSELQTRSSSFSNEIFLGDKASKIFALEESEHNMFLGLVKGHVLMGIGLLNQTRYFPAIAELNLALSSLTNLQNLVIPCLLDKEKYQSDVRELKVLIVERLIEALRVVNDLDDVPRLFEELLLIKEKIGGNLVTALLAFKISLFHFETKSFSLALEKCNGIIGVFQENSFHALKIRRLVYLIQLFLKPSEPRHHFLITELTRGFDLYEEWVTMELQFIDHVISIEGVPDVILKVQCERILHELLKKAKSAPFMFRFLPSIQSKYAKWLLWRRKDVHHDIHDVELATNTVQKVYYEIEDQLQKNGLMYGFKDVLEEVTHLTLDVSQKYGTTTLLGRLILILEKFLSSVPVGMKGMVLFMKGKVHLADYNAAESAICFDMAKESLIVTHGSNHPVVTLVSAGKIEAIRMEQGNKDDWVGSED